MASGMASGFVRSYRDLMENQSDARVKDYFLMSSPFPLACIILTYIWMVKYAGPRWMKNREPFDLRLFLKVYNAAQIIYNAWLFAEGVIGWSQHYDKLGCAPVDRSDHPQSVKVVDLVWWYFILKLTELIDTITFVLRKKDAHVSTLHVVHHSIMPISAWVATKFLPGGHSTVTGLLNTGVHIVMYSYYFITCFGPNAQKYLFWKRYITLLQMYQFLIIMVHSMQLLIRSECDYPKPFAVWIIIQAAMFYAMFNEFYKHHYKRSGPLSALFEKKKA